ncbi:MAG: hypothetical protein GYB65_19455 [Chloroflexi bacterium]|nr:hypothetical protein [Chloroflexota bacterium]
MQRLRLWWNAFKTVAILFSFTMNLVLLIVLLLLAMQVFQIKNGIVEPLVDGAHRNTVGMDEAVIVTTFKIEDQIPVEFEVPLDQPTTASLTEAVFIDPPPTVIITGDAEVNAGEWRIEGEMQLTLPEGLELPVNLNMTMPVEDTIEVNTPVKVAIPVNETELHYPYDNLRALLEPYVRILDHLPDSWDDMPDFTVDAIQGDGVNLVSPSADSVDPWPGPPTATPAATTPADEANDSSGNTAPTTADQPDDDSAPTESESSDPPGDQ